MVQITPQKPALVLPNWSWPLWLSVTLLFLSVGAFIFFKAYLARVQSEIADINNKIKIEAGRVNIDDENSVVRLGESLSAFAHIVSNHSYFSEMLNLIGSLTYSKVIFTKFDADREKGVINLRGLTQNYTALAKQIVALREKDSIKSLEIRGINFSTTGLEFELTLGVIPKVFIK